jgi:hypothetical protein
MKSIAILSLVALALVVLGCGATNTLTTNVSGTWEATLTSTSGGNSNTLSFITTFSLNLNGSLNVTNFTFLNTGGCFVSNTLPVGTAVLTTSGTNQVTGPFNFTVASSNPGGNTLTLSGTLTGTSNGTTTTVGTLSNGVVKGGWTLSNSSDADCTGSGSFTMCQGAATCST